MELVQIMSAGITEESAAAWWLKQYAGVDGPVIRSGRLNKKGTPLYDTNWSPAEALVALKLRAIGQFSLNEIARQINKSWHAVRDLFARIDAAGVINAR